MNLDDLISALETARDQNCGGVLEAITEQGASFDMLDVEVGLYSGDVVVRLRPAEEA